MKTQLTREESQHLIDLGVSKEKASLSVLFEEDGPFDIWNEDILARPIFTIFDFLNGEILPKEIEGGLPLCFSMDNKKCMCSYLIMDESHQKTKELIDGLYQLACWYYGEYLKNK